MAVIGLGSTGVQVIQEMGKVAENLTVFLRSPNWCTPLGNAQAALDGALRYVREQTFMLDLRIIAATVRRVFFGW